MTDWRESLGSDDRDRLEKTAMPDSFGVMKATLTDDCFSDPDWMYERKLDGERCLAFHDHNATHLYSRKPRCLDASYPEIRDALAKQSVSCVVDGELVAFDGQVSSFSRLQKRMQIRNEDEARESGIAVYYYVFDLLYLDGYDICDLPLRERKRLLHLALDFEDPLRFTPHRNGEGEAYFEEACAKGWEGLIAKDAASRYSRSRSRKWLKFKCTWQQELVIVGYTDPEGQRAGFGALLVGYYEDDSLHYAGRVGTGYDEETLESLHGKLSRLERKSSPIVESDEADGKGVHWVKPELVAEIGFTEWTPGNRLRHPRYLGLRDDKSPREVVREIPERAGD